MQLVCSVEYSTYSRNTALQECRDEYECGYHLGWFRVERGGAAYTPDFESMSVRLLVTVCEFRSIERVNTVVVMAWGCE